MNMKLACTALVLLAALCAEAKHYSFVNGYPASGVTAARAKSLESDGISISAKASVKPTTAVKTNVVAVVQCQSATQSGSRCKRRAVKGTRYCRQHAAAAPVKKPFKTCQAIAENGEACKEKPKPDSRYCEKHGK